MVINIFEEIYGDLVNNSAMFLDNDYEFLKSVASFGVSNGYITDSQRFYFIKCASKYLDFINKSKATWNFIRIDKAFVIDKSFVEKYTPYSMTKRQAEILGENYPLVSGWRKRIMGRLVSNDQLKEIESERYSKLKGRRLPKKLLKNSVNKTKLNISTVILQPDSLEGRGIP